MKILALGTYPIARPVHGGQRRTAQIGDYYRRSGHDYAYACVYASTYGPDQVGPNDYPLANVGGIYGQLPYIDDMASGVFAAGQSGPWQHFCALIEKLEPDLIQIEQPFMWPLVRRLVAEGLAPGVRIVYSSHNVEADLKQRILEGAGVPRAKAARVSANIAGLEDELVAVAEIVIAVSASDAAYYRSRNPSVEIVIVRNGTDRPADTSGPGPNGGEASDDQLFFVGSAYPPNVEGFEHFVLENTLYGLPPRKCLTVCGGASVGIGQSRLYRPHVASYDDRVTFVAAPTDESLTRVNRRSKGSILPIATGGGSNLKTAEALANGKWVVASPLAMRSFEEFVNAPGVLVASTPRAFMAAMLDVLHGPPLVLGADEAHDRSNLYWDRTLEDSGLAARLSRHGSPGDQPG